MNNHFFCFFIIIIIILVRTEEDEILDNENIENLNLKPCPRCSRTFLEPALEKHISICEKMNFQRRQPFDSFRQRREGTELATYLPSDYGLIKQRSPSLNRESTRSISKSVIKIYIYIYLFVFPNANCKF